MVWLAIKKNFPINKRNQTVWSEWNIFMLHFIKINLKTKIFFPSMSNFLILRISTFCLMVSAISAFVWASPQRVCEDICDSFLSEWEREIVWQLDAELPSLCLSSTPFQTVPWNVTLCWHRESVCMCVFALCQTALERQDFKALEHSRVRV